MMRATLKTNPDVIETVKAASWERLQRVVVYFWQQCQLALNISAGPQYVRRQRDTAAGPKGSQYTVYTNPSKKGEPPHKRTGVGQKGTVFNLDEKAGSGRVGFIRNAWYLGYHEFRDRSTLLHTLDLNRDRLKAIAGGK